MVWSLTHYLAWENQFTSLCLCSLVIWDPWGSAGLHPWGWVEVCLSVPLTFHWTPAREREYSCSMWVLHTRVALLFLSVGIMSILLFNSFAALEWMINAFRLLSCSLGSPGIVVSCRKIECRSFFLQRNWFKWCFCAVPLLNSIPKKLQQFIWGKELY